MKPITYVWIWLTELFTVSVIYSVICFFMPDEAIFNWYEEKYGFVIETKWYNWYTLILYIASIALTSGLIWLTAYLFRKRRAVDILK